ncbi:MAG TPA: ABC transporter ATP-binding protein [Clostridiales bacterium]|jgi:NitT/TauT family transport system ATP-binding protein|nr:ABC transporter ATP-binding protein [Clostridiales bacterium]
MHPLVEVKNVGLVYHEPHAETQALKNLNMTVNEGEFVAIIGPSGCGKTSLLSLLSGFIKPSEGEVLIRGKSIDETDASKSQIGYMLQHDHLLDWRTIEGNVLLGLQVKHMLTPETHEYALELLNRYGLYEFRNHYPRQLSGGMRQKAALIRTLAFSPCLLLLDEPFSSLDYLTRLKLGDEVYKIIKSEGKTAILVTHDIAEAISMANRIYVFTQRPASVRSEYNIELNKDNGALATRNLPGFKEYFDTLWKELDHEQTKNRAE